jgi:hypothetical protein
MSSPAQPIPVSQQMLATFVTKYRLQRATLDGVTFFMNPDVTQSNAWLTNLSPTGSGYVRWTYGAQPYTLRLDGTTGVLGYDSGNRNLGGAKQLYGRFAPGWTTGGIGDQNRQFRFVFPAMGINTLAYVDAFTRSMTSQKSLYIFFSIQLTILPPKVAQDYQPVTPNVPLPGLPTARVIRPPFGQRAF